MINTLALASLAVLAAPQQNAQEILQMVMTKQAAREAPVSNYTVIQTVQGNEVPMYYEKARIGGMALFRLVPMAEWQARGSDPAMSTAVAAPMADGLDMIADGMAKEMASVPGGGMFAGAVTNMTNDMSFFLRTAYHPDSIAKYTNDGRADAARNRSDMALFAQRARLVGRETVSGVEAFHLRVTDMSGITLEQPEAGGEFALTDANIWVDATEFVPVRLLMNGSMTSQGRTTPITIELLQLDYQRAGSLYLPARHVMRLGGLMEAMSLDPKQRQEMEKARREAAKMQEQMVDMDAQMAKMPAAARRMIEGRMEQAVAQLDQMLSGGTIEMEMEFRVYEVDKGPPVSWRPGKDDR
jgi:hypothetical protein